MAPATRPATPATNTLLGVACAAAPPSTRLEVERMPSFAPSTAARSQPMRPVRCRSLLPIGILEVSLIGERPFWSATVPRLITCLTPRGERGFHFPVPFPDSEDGRIDHEFHQKRNQYSADQGCRDALHHVGSAAHRPKDRQ